MQSPKNRDMLESVLQRARKGNTFVFKSGIHLGIGLGRIGMKMDLHSFRSWLLILSILKRIRS